MSKTIYAQGDGGSIKFLISCGKFTIIQAGEVIGQYEFRTKTDCQRMLEYCCTQIAAPDRKPYDVYYASHDYEPEHASGSWQHFQNENQRK